MERRSIGDIEFSIVGLGGYEFEDDPDWAGARDVLQAAAETGIDWVDTAETYFDGGSERTIGRGAPGHRRLVRISSKVGPARGGTGFRPEQVRRACEASLGRLGVDHLDQYLLQVGGPIWCGARRSVCSSCLQ